MANGKQETGRPTKLTVELQAAISALVEAGDRPEVAAGVNGIGRATYFEWMQRGAGGEQPYEAFRTSVLRAIDKFESDSRKVILGGDRNESFGPAKARLEVISRRMPRHWAQQVKHHVETVEEEFFETLRSVCSDPTIHTRVREAQDCGLIFAAFCEALARRESEEASGEAGAGEAGPVH